MIIKKTRFFTVWQDEKEEKWLMDLDKKGLILKKVKGIVYTFEKKEPQNYIYKLDFKSTSNKDIDEYISIYEDAGWEHVGTFNSWHYFRTKNETSNFPDIYSDKESKIEKYQRILKNLNLAIGLIIMIGVTNALSLKHPFLVIIMLMVLTILIYANYRIRNTIKKILRDF